MTQHDDATNSTGSTPATFSRRQFIGTAAAGSAAVGLAGCSMFAQTARAQADVNFEDKTVTIGPETTVENVFVTGSVEVSYTVTTEDVDHVDMTVNAFAPGGGQDSDNQSFTADDVDVDSDTITRDVELSVLSNGNTVDPQPGGFDAFDYVVEVYAVVEGTETTIVDEVIADDTATLRVEREAAGDGGDGSDGGAGGDGNSTNGDGNGDVTVETNVGGSFTFTVETA